MQPFQQGLQSYRQGMDKQFEGERALKKEQLAERADTRQQQAFNLEQQKAKVAGGNVIEFYSDGTSATNNRVQLQNFNDPSSLMRDGNNLYSSLAAAGPVVAWTQSDS